ncbi:hypothetical protein Tco_0636711 [Tanacetum coccineum]
MIARPVIMKAKLPVSAWGHVVLHAATLIRIRPTTCEQEVQRIIHLQGLANQLPDAFTDLKRATKSHIPAANAHVKVDVPKEHSEIANESKARLKRGRPIGSKDKNPRKKKGACNQDGQIEVKETLEGSFIRTLDMMVLKEPQDHEPKLVPECKNRNDWPKWKDAIEAELKSLEKREVFGPVVCTLEGVKPVGSGPEYVIIDVYVDDLNIIGTPGELPKAVEYLKKEFEMKDLGKTKFYDDEEMLGPEVPYLSAIGALLFLASHTRPDISFSLNLLARYNSCPTRRHWNGVKQIFHYLQGTKDMGLYYTISSERNLVCFADAGYMSDPHTGRSQTGYVFTSSNTAISWRSVKQTMSATSSNHAEILAIHEASRECVWLRSVIQHIRESCGISSGQEAPTIVHEDNAACIAQLKDGYIKGDRTKHILPKFFFTHDLQKSGDIIVQQIRSSDNLADLFTKALPTATFKKLVHGIGMRRLKELK